MTQSKFIFLTMANLVLMIVFTEPTFKFINNSFLLTYEPLLEPFFLLLIGSLFSTIVLYIKKEFFRIWFKKFFIWYFPSTLLLTFMFPTSGYTMPHRYDMAVLFSSLMVFVTLVMVGYSYFRKIGQGIEDKNP